MNIEFARNEYPEINFYVGTFEEFLEHEKKSIEIDIIILSDILEHVENDVKLLKMAGNCAKYILVNIPMEKCWRNRKEKYDFGDAAGHLRAYNLRDIQRLIPNSGLSIIDFTVKYYCKEAIYEKHLKERLFRDISKFRLLTRMPKSIIFFLVDNIFFRYFNPSNFFGLLSK